MKKPIIIILTASLLLFVALPSINAGPPPPNQVRIEDSFEDDPFIEVDSITHPDKNEPISTTIEETIDSNLEIYSFMDIFLGQVKEIFMAGMDNILNIVARIDK